MFELPPKRPRPDTCVPVPQQEFRSFGDFGRMLFLCQQWDQTRRDRIRERELARLREVQRFD